MLRRVVLAAVLGAAVAAVACSAGEGVNGLAT